MKYFTNCKTAEDVKKQYRENARKHHPDLGGDAEKFKEMHAEYEQLFNRLKYTHQNAEGKTYEKPTDETPEEFANIINALIRLKGIEVEICGSWIWVSGNTIEHKDILKDLHFKWANKKQAWYFHSEPYKKRSNRELSLEEIRDMFGSKHYDQTEEEKRLKAVV